MKLADKIISIISILLIVSMIGLIIYAFNLPAAESVYIPRSELKELF